MFFVCFREEVNGFMRGIEMLVIYGMAHMFLNKVDGVMVEERIVFCIVF